MLRNQRPAPFTLALLLSAALLAACSSDPDPLVGGGADVGQDTDADDLDTDQPGPDADIDPQPDADIDPQPDADIDPQPDADIDADLDPQPDADLDADLDPQPDADLDTGPQPTTIFPGFCPSNPTQPGYYQGTLAMNLNDINGCGGVSAPGRDGSLRVELGPNQTLTAQYQHDGDGAIYLLDTCPVVASCLVASDTSTNGWITLEWTNGPTDNVVYLVLDSKALDGPQTFRLDLHVGP